MWYEFLYYWCYVKIPVGSGLTIPFLVGLEREYGLKKDFSTNELLNEFKNLDSGHIISIRYCDNIGAYVCCLDNSYADNETKHYKIFGSLFLELEDNTKESVFEDILSDFHAIYMDIINSEGYSFNNGNWTKFTKADIALINEIG